ncbi:MAG: 16S rRNA (cytidine(1402)-2'-O)-methyltransferase [bacterium]
MIGKLYLIATPIGNLEDITLRALAVLKQVDLLLCEDTRVTRRLLERHGLEVKTESYREQVHGRQLGKVLERLRDGEQVGLVSDAGTPGVSDPGSLLVRDLLAAEPELEIVPVPGPSASVAAISVAGFPAAAFTFLGFPPHKKGRTAFFREALDYPHPVVLYESPHRIEKALELLSELDSDRRMCLLRELTKVHETVYRGTPGEILAGLAATSTRGEFVLVIDGKKK